MNTMEALNAKVVRFKKRYASESTMPPGEVLGLIDDLSATLTAVRVKTEELDQRVLNLEGRVNHMNTVM